MSPAKADFIGLSRCTARELGGEGITVNANTRGSTERTGHRDLPARRG